MNKKTKIIILVLLIVLLSSGGVLLYFYNNSKQVINEKIVIRFADKNLFEENTSESEETMSFIARDNTEVWENNGIIKFFEEDQTLAPGSHGTYSFFVDNPNENNFKYLMKFTEDNEHKANILFKLLRNGIYVAGDENTWVHFNELDFKNKLIHPSETDSYTIEWRWVDASNDTEVGMAGNAKYRLNLLLSAYDEFYEPEDMGEGDGDDTEEDKPTPTVVIEDDDKKDTKIIIKNPFTGDDIVLNNPLTGDNIILYIIIAIVSVLLLALIRVIKKDK